jgi:serine/threonine protein kinase
VALKVLGPALTQSADKARFLREAQAVAKLKHPGIASVHFIGQDSQLCYYAMEYIDGVSLRSVIESLRTSRDPQLSLDTALHPSWTSESTSEEVRFDAPTATFHSEPTDEHTAIGPGEISPEASRLIANKDYIRRCCEIVKTVALALAHAHERGVIHRDIKPENILLDRQGNPYIIDFGLARFFEDMTVTNTGALVGTPAYMSPEQVTGRIQLDHRTDIYSIGLVLYEMLTLRRPFASETREGVLRKVVAKALPPVSWKNHRVPRDVESVVHKATAKDPDERYQTSNNLAEDLRNSVEGRPIVAKPYRYLFDDKQISAERPREIVWIAFFFFLLGIVWITFACVISATLELAYRFQTAVLAAPVLAALLAWLSVPCLFATAFGLMDGSRSARLLATASSLLVTGTLLLYRLAHTRALEGQNS